MSGLFVLAACVGIGVSQSVFAYRILNDSLVGNVFQNQALRETYADGVDEAGRIQFNRLKANPKRLNQYLDQLKAASPDSQPGLFKTRQARMAYWINAHNVLALRLVLDAYPVKTTAEIKDYLDNRRYAFGGRFMSLRQMENRIFKEFYHWPEVFFALSRLDETSPPLSRTPFEGTKMLDEALKARMSAILANPEMFRVVESEPCAEIHLSPWFKEILPPLKQASYKDSGKSKHWLWVLMPSLPPEAQGALAKTCSHKMDWLPLQPVLRDAAL